MHFYFKKLINSLIILMSAVIVGAVCLMAVYAIPTERMFNHVNDSIKIYQHEGDYPSWAPGKSSSHLDNFTDSIIVRNTIYPGSGAIVRDAMLNPKFFYDKSSQTQSLVLQLQDVENPRTSYYPQYWHGYLIFMKPLTFFFNIQYIRLLNAMLQILLAAYLMLLLGQKFGQGYGFAYLLSYLFLNPISLALSFQFSSMYYIMSFVSLILLKKWHIFQKNRRYIYLFLIAGIITAYFDLLTYPFVSLGIPLIILLVGLNNQRLLKDSAEAGRVILGSTVFWGIGYGGMYIGKWLLSWGMTGINVVAVATAQLNHRISYNGSDSSDILVAINPVKAISKNLQIPIHEPIFPILIIALLICCYLLYKLSHNRTKLKFNDFSILKISLTFIALYPFFWYAFLCNHSFIHCWFTYRELVIVVFALGSLISAVFYEYRK